MRVNKLTALCAAGGPGPGFEPSQVSGPGGNRHSKGRVEYRARWLQVAATAASGTSSCPEPAVPYDVRVFVSRTQARISRPGTNTRHRGTGMMSQAASGVKMPSRYTFLEEALHHY